MFLILSEDRVEVSEDWLTSDRLTFPVFGGLEDFSYDTKSQTSAELQVLLRWTSADLHKPGVTPGRT